MREVIKNIVENTSVSAIPILNCAYVSIPISTRSGNNLYEWGDGEYHTMVTSKMTDATTSTIYVSTHNFATLSSNNIKVYAPKGIKDIYSMTISGGITINNTRYNIQNFGDYIQQFNNLYSFRFECYAYGENSIRSTIKGNMCSFSKSVERVLIGNCDVIDRINSLYMNLDGLPTNSNLKWLRKGGGVSADFENLNISGNIGNIPTSCYYFSTSSVINSGLTYSSKVWNSNLDTFLIDADISSTINDNILNDMSASVLTSTGDKLIQNRGVRTQSSDTSVSYLRGLGFNINIQRVHDANSLILNTAFQNNLNNTLVPPNEGNVISGTSLPTYTTGRKGTDYCAVFDGSKSVNTTNNFLINNTNKITFSFWIKKDITVEGSAVLFETRSSLTNSFSVVMRSNNATVLFRSQNSGLLNESLVSIPNNTWVHVAGVIDRGLPASDEIKIYVNGVISPYTKPNSGDTSGNFENTRTYICQRDGSSLGFIGSLQDVKIFNYALNATEILALYNE